MYIFKVFLYILASSVMAYEDHKKRDVTLTILHGGAVDSDTSECSLPPVLTVLIECAAHGELLAETTVEKASVVSAGQRLTELEIQAYHNHSVGAAFVVKCVVSDTNKAFIKLEGSFYLSGLKYRLYQDDRERQEHDLYFSRHHISSTYSMSQVFEHKPSDAWAVQEAARKNKLDTGNAKYSTLDEFFDKPEYLNHRLVRHRRDTTTYDIDVYPVVDYSLYNRFATVLYSGANFSEPSNPISDYLINIFTAVDMRFRTLQIPDTAFRISMLDPYIINNSVDSAFVEDIKETTKQGIQVNATDLLTRFTRWATDNSLFTGVDHVMLFTAYDLISVDGTNTDIRGLANLGAFCSDSSTSVVEDIGAYQSENVAAHELAHSFDALHDGDANTCTAEDRYIMSPRSYQVTQSNKLNPWIFSNCTSEEIASFLSRQSAEISTCWANTSGEIAETVRNITSDELCVLYLGDSTAFTCRSWTTSFSEICTAMYCRTETNSVCYGLVTSTGTCCGNQKRCESGECVAANDGECPMDETCPLGDQPSIPLAGYSTCDEIPSYYCYDDSVFQYCCETCKRYDINITDCQYGDTVESLQLNNCTDATLAQCQTANSSTSLYCCGTCAQIIASITTTAPPTTPEASTSTESPSTSTESSSTSTAAGSETSETSPTSAVSTAETTETSEDDDDSIWGYKPDGFHGCYVPPCAAVKLFSNVKGVLALSLACSLFVSYLGRHL